MEHPAKQRVLVVQSKKELAECKAMIDGHEYLGWDCEGVKLGRSGKLCVVQFSTPSTCFVLDMLCDDAPELLGLCKDILENERICKVIHDPAADSDLLYHQFGITVVNVHDTQAWHMAIEKIGDRKGINSTLKAFGCSFNPERSADIYKTNPQYWATRPMSDDMILRASEDVGNLLLLQARQVAMADESTRAEAARLSMARTGFMRDCLAQPIHVHPTQMGNFIGKQGVNINHLKETTQTHIHQYGERDFNVYADTEERLNAAMERIAVYTRPWQYTPPSI